MSLPLKFRRITADDYDLIMSYTRPMGGSLSCEYSFANLLCWGELYEMGCYEENHLLWLYNGKEDYLYFPLGKIDDSIPSTLWKMARSLKQEGFSGIIDQVPQRYWNDNALKLSMFHFHSDNRFWDYVYKAESLALLPGSVLGKKRNLCNQFEKLYPHWHLERLDYKTAMSWLPEFLFVWEQSAGRDGGSVEEDLEALKEVFLYWDEGHFEGLILSVEKIKVAFCIWSQSTDEMITVHFEKAQRDFKGGSQIINRECAKLVYSQGIKWINREQDLGVVGLVHSKRSYLPEYMLEVGFLDLVEVSDG